MALLSCPECEREVSDRAHTCPGCGYPLAETLPVAEQRQAKPTKEPVPSRARYFIRDQDGKTAGPFSTQDLKKQAKDGRISPSWQISTDQKTWKPIARVQNLFDDLESALSEHVTAGGEERALTRQEQIKLFVDEFVVQNEQFQNSLQIIQLIRRGWARITLPSKGFVISHVTKDGTRHVKHNIAAETVTEIDQQELDETVSSGVGQIDWFKLAATLVGAIWLIWSFKDFSFSFGADTLKALLLGGIVLAAFIYKTRQTKVYVAYEMDDTARHKLDSIADAFRTITKCGRVWMFQIQKNKGEMNWKYNAGQSFSVSRLPAAIFNRPIPNIETNIRVHGLTHRHRAIYFLPDGLLLVDGRQVHRFSSCDLEVSHRHFEYVEMEGKIYGDSQEIDKRWQYINKDGSRDKRFNNNKQLPVVRCGILCLTLDGNRFEIMTTNPNAPERFETHFSAIRSTLESNQR